ncbi:MAG: ParB N-terminal domain-containing protein [Treponema sp.]|nr:ParB N-terminal domain-containing protein [Treponema sp.]
MPKLENAGRFRQIPLDQIIVGENVRTDYNNIDELANSILTVGQLEPALVKSLGKNNDTGLEMFEIVAGHRRRLACLRLRERGESVSMLDSVIVSGERLTLQLIENLQRDDLSPRDREAGIYKLAQSGITNKEIAARLSLNGTFISRNLTAYKIRSAAEKEAQGDKKRITEISNISTQALSEITGVKKEHMARMVQKLIDGGGTLSCARQLMREYNSSNKEPSLVSIDNTSPEKNESAEFSDPLMDDDTLPDDGNIHVLPPQETKTTSAKKSASQSPARTLEIPPHKKVDLNSVQVVIQEYIDKVSSGEAGYEYEYKTDAAYEIWALLLAELAGQ